MISFGYNAKVTFMEKSIPVESAPKPMSGTERDLYEAVLDAPSDDGPRLVYADWLDEHGEPEQAKFIRLQIESENQRKGNPLASPENDRRQNEIEKQEKAHLTDPELRSQLDRWCIKYGVGGQDVYRLGWLRGFPSVLNCTMMDFLSPAGGLGKRGANLWPLTHVAITDKRPDPIGDHWCWLRDRRGLEAYPQSTLNPMVYSMLDGGRVEYAGEEWRRATRASAEDTWTIYQTPKEAMMALSNSCLAIFSLYREAWKLVKSGRLKLSRTGEKTFLRQKRKL